MNNYEINKFIQEQVLFLKMSEFLIAFRKFVQLFSTFQRIEIKWKFNRKQTPLKELPQCFR